jgi:hypothetical protein
MVVAHFFLLVCSQWRIQHTLLQRSSSQWFTVADLTQEAQFARIGQWDQWKCEGSRGMDSNVDWDDHWKWQGPSGWRSSPDFPSVISSVDVNQSTKRSLQVTPSSWKDQFQGSSEFCRGTTLWSSLLRFPGTTLPSSSFDFRIGREENFNGLRKSRKKMSDGSVVHFSSLTDFELNDSVNWRNCFTILSAWISLISTSKFY